MTYHTVEAWVSIYDKVWLDLVDIPNGTLDKDAYCRNVLNKSNYGNVLYIQTCEMAPGEYYPRMSRPYHIHNNWIGVKGHGPLYLNAENMARTLPSDANALGNSVNQLAILVEALKRIMEFIQPHPSNFATFGHQTRNLLILACMDFENECRGVLEANGYTAASGRMNTTDYVKLLKPLRLAEYEVVLSNYQQLPPISPFTSWNIAAATGSLSWYDSYNKTKHNRESHFNRATLLEVVNSICAVAIMLAAQYRVIATWEDQIGHFFTFRKHPHWDVSRYYLPQPWPPGWVPVLHSF